MLNEEQLIEVAKKTKTPLNEVRRAAHYAIRHPSDHLQPGDPRFERVWGKEQKKNKERLEKRKKDDEALLKEREEFEKRKKGIDKVHKRFTIV